MFVFRVPRADADAEAEDSFRWVLHTGDFRASEELISNPRLVGLAGVKFEMVHLDTTYCDPQYAFPSQGTVVEECKRCVDRLVNKHDQRLFSPIRRLVLVGSYLVGKEKIAVSVAQLLSSSIYCSARKRTVFACMQWPELAVRLTREPGAAQVHVVSMAELDPERVGETLDRLWPKYTHALVIRPTGWAFGCAKGPKSGPLVFHDHVKKDTHGQPIRRRGTIAVYSAPYSEHSSFPELASFLSAPWLAYDRLVPTVDNPLDLYLRREDYESGEELLLSWHRRRQQSEQ